jgi:hypothetical protein
MEVRNDVVGHDFASNIEMDVAVHHSHPPAYFIVIRFRACSKTCGSERGRLASVAPPSQWRR